MWGKWVFFERGPSYTQDESTMIGKWPSNDPKSSFFQVPASHKASKRRSLEASRSADPNVIPKWHQVNLRILSLLLIGSAVGFSISLGFLPFAGHFFAPDPFCFNLCSPCSCRGPGGGREAIWILYITAELLGRRNMVLHMPLPHIRHTRSL